MIVKKSHIERRGITLPLLAICMVGLCGFTALAVDVGMIAVAKNQAQNAADVAALTAARSIDGSASPNLTGAGGATVNAQTAAGANQILGSTVKSSELTLQFGAYHYDDPSQTFIAQYPPVSPDTYNLAQATVTHTLSTAFAQILGLASTNVTASSTAAHRPRDVSIILDFSGSMNNESDVWNAESYLGALDHTPNSLDSVFPQFGHYSNIGSAQLQCTSSDPMVGKSNNTQAALGVSAMVNDYYQSARGATTPVGAFVPASVNYATTPGGDNYLTTNKNTTGTYATTIKDVTTSTTRYANFETNGYKYYTTKTFNGYTAGPNYWGKTFFIWPPDPTNDWRKKFFFKAGGSYPNFGGPVDDNTYLWDNTGAWQDPPGNYVINYKAILSWISNTGVNPFPPQLRGGYILYYDKIPTDVPVSAYDPNQLNSAITDPTVRFWKEYIDYVLGVWQDPFGNIQHADNPSCSIGPDFTWGTIQISAKPTGGTPAYMNYLDNPQRPRQRMWFSPTNMIQFMSDTGLFPGTARDISMYPAKVGIMGALQNIQLNHPNDLVSMILFSRPQFANDPPGVGAFSNAQYSLSRNYTAMINSLWNPPNSGTNDVRPWDVNQAQTPAAHGDYCANTTLKHGYMLAYNQFSENSTVRGTIVAGQAVGGLGRKGAQRLVINELDGMANYDSIPTGGFQNSGPYQSYYKILPGNTVNGGNYDQDSLLQVVQAICNNSDGSPGSSPGYSNNPGYSGFSTTRKPVLIHTIAFGAIFEPSASGGQSASAVSLLQQISSIGGTVFPSSSGDPTNGYKWCIGDMPTRIAKLATAFDTVMNDGASVSLVQ